jgi:F-type H+-transporting ATPase subunit epsilon
MAEALYIEIITPAKITYKGNIESVTVPGVKGSFQVLKNHAPLISVLDIGLVKIKENENSTKYFATSGGTVEVLNNYILVLADSLEALDEIDIERAQRAKERAMERLTHKTEDTDIERARTALARSVNRLNLVEKYMRAEA